MSKIRQRAIQVEARVYQLIANQLYKRCKDNQLRLCVSESEYIPVLQDAHSGITGGHFSADRTAKIIMFVGLWWPTMFMDAEEYVKRCDECQRTKIPIRKDEMSMRPMMGARAFAKWGIDFVGPFHRRPTNHIQNI